MLQSRGAGLAGVGWRAHRDLPLPASPRNGRPSLGASIAGGYETTLPVGGAAGCHPVAHAAWDDLLRHAESGADLMAGHHNRNYAVRLPAHLAEGAGLRANDLVKVRVPIRDGLAFDQVVWKSESATLRALAGRLDHIPRVVAVRPGFAVHTYEPGRVLQKLAPPGTRQVRGRMRAVASVLARFAALPIDGLPEPEGGWPDDWETAFLHHLVDYTEQRVHRPARARYGALLDALGFPQDAMTQFRDRLPALRRRPFTLVHGDLHHGNLVVRPQGGLHVLDWELAMAGDPLHDLAIHLVRADIPGRQRAQFVRVWQSAVGAVQPWAVHGAAEDLRWYIAYQRVRSVHTDVIRTVDRLGLDPDRAALDSAAGTVHGILRRAVGTVDLRLPSPQEAHEALLGWLQGSLGGEAVTPDQFGVSQGAKVDPE